MVYKDFLRADCSRAIIYEVCLKRYASAELSWLDSHTTTAKKNKYESKLKRIKM